ncbi:MAG: PRC-barrel domain-containing protein [Desulfurivibrionaceae bacterium]
MKSKLMIMGIGVFSIFLVASVASAEMETGSEQGDLSKSEMSEKADTQKEAMQESGMYSKNLKSANKLSGTKVFDSKNKNLGKVNDVIVDTASGKVTYIILTSGGVFGVGGEDYPIPWKALKQKEDKKGLQLKTASEELKDAPAGTRISSRDQERKIHEFYGVSPHWEEGERHKYQEEIETESTKMKGPEADGEDQQDQAE